MNWLFFALASTLCWAMVNVLDSLLVHKYEKSPFLLMWSQALFSVPCLVALSLIADIHSSWAPLLLLIGTTAYLGDLWFFYVLDRLDVSVSNAAWPILSIILAVAGVFLFQETWGVHQLTGSVLIIAGILFLSFWHMHVSILRTVGLLSTQALLYVGFYITKKYALDAGESVVSVFFWMILGRETLALTLPLLRNRTRVRLKALVGRMDAEYFVIGGIVIASFLAAEYLGAMSYAVGPLSLIAMVSNVQPFMVIGLAWVFHLFLPKYAPREVISVQSASIKTVSFLVVFLGLALLTVSQ